MKSKSIFLMLATLILLAGNTLHAQTDTNALPPEVAKLLKSLKYQQGDISLDGGLAELTVPKEFNFLNSDDAETVLVKLWGNPPPDPKPLGLLIPAGLTPINSNCWVVTITYDNKGHVKDDDAKTIDYNKLLSQMQQGVQEANKVRQEKGYPTVQLLGWAEPPHYDAATHKLYWAKKLQFEGETDQTLNYSIRMLGRKGVLELNAIASMNQLSEINDQTPAILGMVDFKEGNRYADFDPKVDKVATYGLAALVAGGLVAGAAKAGLLKVAWLGLLGAKKLIIFVALAVGAYLKKLFGRGKSSGGPQS